MTADLIETRGTSLARWASEAEAAAGIARSLAGTAFIPASLKITDNSGRIDHDATTAQVAAALLTGQELGLEPMASLRSIDVIRGTPALRAIALRALLQQHGHQIWVVESTASRAVVRGRRGGVIGGEVQESTWTTDRARQLGIHGYGDPKGPWMRQPQAMLVARATAECARLVAADVLLGLPYIAEEVQDVTDAEPEPLPVEPASPRQRTARRRSQPPAPNGPGGPLPPPPPPPPPAIGTGTAPRGRAEGQAAGPGTGALDDADGSAEHAGDPAPDPSRPGPAALITASQRAKLWAGLKDIGMEDRDEALAQISAWAGRDVTSTNDLSMHEASDVIDAIDAVRAGQPGGTDDG